MNKIEEYLNNIDSKEDLSKYFTQYISNQYPNEWRDFEEKNKPEEVKLNTVNIPGMSTYKSNYANPSGQKNYFDIKPIRYSQNTTQSTPQSTTNITQSTPQSTTNTTSTSGTSFKSNKEFIEAILPGARRIAAKYGIDENIILSQAAFESGYGKNSLTSKANNIFSITTGNSWKGGVYKGIDHNQAGERKEGVPFRKYNSLEESLEDWAKMVLNPNSRNYAKSYEAAKISPEEFAKVHAWSGYAEGIGTTKEDAKNKLNKSYISSYNNILKLREKYNI